MKNKEMKENTEDPHNDIARVNYVVIAGVFKAGFYCITMEITLFTENTVKLVANITFCTTKLSQWKYSQ